MNKNAQEDKIVSPQTSNQLAPNRVLGLSIMCAMIVFVAIWMNVQSGQSTSEEIISTENGENGIAGFRPDAWYLPDDELFGFINIPAGSFVMGSNPALDRLAYENERWSSSRRQGSVEMPEFYIAKFEVTVAQFKAFTLDSPNQASSIPANAINNYPITNITWPEALAYARWLEAKLKASMTTPPELREFLVSGGHVTLPTEAEWEKAARGEDGRIFPWGNQARNELANYGSDSVLPVGSKICSQCAYGIADMSGNVWELTRSPLQAYPYNLDDDGENLSEDALWVMRGGSFSDAVGNVRAAVRGAVDPGVRNNTIGFRLVLSKF